MNLPEEYKKQQQAPLEPEQYQLDHQQQNLQQQQRDGAGSQLHPSGSATVPAVANIALLEDSMLTPAVVRQVWLQKQLAEGQQQQHGPRQEQHRRSQDCPLSHARRSSTGNADAQIGAAADHCGTSSSDAAAADAARVTWEDDEQITPAAVKKMWLEELQRQEQQKQQEQQQQRVLRQRGGRLFGEQEQRPEQWEHGEEKTQQRVCRQEEGHEQLRNLRQQSQQQEALSSLRQEDCMGRCGKGGAVGKAEEPVAGGFPAQEQQQYGKDEHKQQFDSSVTIHAVAHVGMGLTLRLPTAAAVSTAAAPVEMVPAAVAVAAARVMTCSRGFITSDSDQPASSLVGPACISRSPPSAKVTIADTAPGSNTCSSSPFSLQGSNQPRPVCSPFAVLPTSQTSADISTAGVSAGDVPHSDRDRAMGGDGGKGLQVDTGHYGAICSTNGNTGRRRLTLSDSSAAAGHDISGGNKGTAVVMGGCTASTHDAEVQVGFGVAGSAGGAGWDGMWDAAGGHERGRVGWLQPPGVVATMVSRATSIEGLEVSTAPWVKAGVPAAAAGSRVTTEAEGQAAGAAEGSRRESQGPAAVARAAQGRTTGEAAGQAAVKEGNSTQPEGPAADEAAPAIGAGDVAQVAPPCHEIRISSASDDGKDAKEEGVSNSTAAAAWDQQECVASDADSGIGEAHAPAGSIKGVNGVGPPPAADLGLQQQADEPSGSGGGVAKRIGSRDCIVVGTGTSHGVAASGADGSGEGADLSRSVPAVGGTSPAPPADRHSDPDGESQGGLGCVIQDDDGLKVALGQLVTAKLAQADAEERLRCALERVSGRGGFWGSKG